MENKESNREIDNSFPAKWWSTLEDGRVLCSLCPRECRIPDGGRGFCFVRKNEGGKLVLTTYGRSSGFCIDSIEKKPLNHFYPGSSILSFGTAGCNLGCQFCQNHDISKARKMDRLMDIASPTGIAETAKKHHCKSVAFTYNDPVIFAEYAIDTAKQCHRLGIKTVAVTAAYISPLAREEFFQHLDAANIDLKAFTNEFYQKLCQGKLKPVLDNLIWLRENTSVWFELTTLIIPGQNDSEEEIQTLAKWVCDHLGADTPLHFTAFHPDYRMSELPSTPVNTLKKAREIALTAGLNFVYIGNVHDDHDSSTWCPQCGELLIGRNWYVLGDWNLKNGTCKSCGCKIPGLFDDHPGIWGAKRQPVSIGY
jgi:pyruvate formate lyase activating enzyme